MTGRGPVDPGSSGASDPPGARARLRRGLGALTSPPWTKAPILLLLYPGLLVAIAGAILILAVVGAAGPLFLSSAGNASLRGAVAAGCSWDVGLHIADTNPLAGRRFLGPEGSTTARDLLLQKEGVIHGQAGSIPGLQPVQVFAMGSTVQAVNPAGNINDPALPPSVRLVYRDHALEHVTKLQPGVAVPGGVWLAGSTAEALGLRPGDPVSFVSGRREVTAPVAGIYRDLSTEARTDFWCTQESSIYPLSAFDNFIPPPFALVDRATFLDLGQELGDRSASFTWAYLPGPDLTVPEAKALSDRIRALTWGRTTFPGAPGPSGSGARSAWTRAFRS